MTPTEAIAAAIAQLEPTTSDLGKVTNSLGEAATVSIAISMKRIADALHREEGAGLPTFLDQLHGVLSDASHDHAQRIRP